MAFEQFVAQRGKDLQRISRHTQGEHQLADVVNEAWVMAHDLADRKGVIVEPVPSAHEALAHVIE